MKLDTLVKPPQYKVGDMVALLPHVSKYVADTHGRIIVIHRVYIVEGYIIFLESNGEERCVHSSDIRPLTKLDIALS